MGGLPNNNMMSQSQGGLPYGMQRNSNIPPNINFQPGFQPNMMPNPNTISNPYLMQNFNPNTNPNPNINPYPMQNLSAQSNYPNFNSNMPGNFQQVNQNLNFDPNTFMKNQPKFN
jgi:hypothetical protein